MGSHRANGAIALLMIGNDGLRVLREKGEPSFFETLPS